MASFGLAATIQHLLAALLWWPVAASQAVPADGAWGRRRPVGVAHAGQRRRPSWRLGRSGLALARRLWCWPGPGGSAGAGLMFSSRLLL
ncbi:MAG: hypothetical protein J3K34DRAFT_75760 [Monoraphidium minutum]|nr:MAG: hypothetical protein J3K34DRAFT_75760 [Monoraphidium minutum]